MKLIKCNELTEDGTTPVYINPEFIDHILTYPEKETDGYVDIPEGSFGVSLAHAPHLLNIDKESGENLLRNLV